METMITSATKQVLISPQQPTVLIGERINPAGKKNLSEALKSGNLDIVRREALEQVQAGADILDVNVTMFGVEETTLLPQAVQTVMETVDVPLCIDSPNPKALEAALKVYKGKPLINSVSGEQHALKTVLPLVKEYGAAVIGLLQDDEGIPNNPERRVAIAHKIVESAEACGIPREDIIIDCLALAVGANTKSGIISIEAAHRIKSELGVNLTMAASNISFGLPNRNVINSASVVIAIATGVNCLIVDVAKIRSIVLAADLVLDRDERARRYLEDYRQSQKH
jgi:5-methyltetrahydrofolate--homocysteine methyltransferase